MLTLSIKKEKGIECPTFGHAWPTLVSSAEARATEEDSRRSRPISNKEHFKTRVVGCKKIRNDFYFHRGCQSGQKFLNEIRGNLLKSKWRIFYPCILFGNDNYISLANSNCIFVSFRYK